jgi:hypothetical protein
VSGHPNLSDAINRNIAQSEADGGIWLRELKDGDDVSIHTLNTRYTLRKRGETLTLEGHSKYCPVPTNAHIAGSTWGGSMLKMGFVGVGMHLEFGTDQHPRVTTSRIVSVALDCARTEKAS